jgi:hypothetical protein
LTAAAKEIKELIASSVALIQDGVKQENKQFSGIVGEIAVASEEQNRGIEQINQAVTQMDEVTLQDATLVEQAAAAAQSFEDQVKKLKEAVCVFRRADIVLPISYAALVQGGPRISKPVLPVKHEESKAAVRSNCAATPMGSSSEVWGAF